MDSQEKALLQQSTLEDPAKKAYATKQEVLERVKENTKKIKKSSIMA